MLQNNTVCFGHEFRNGFLNDDHLDRSMLREYIHIYLLNVGLDKLIKEDTDDNAFLLMWMGVKL